MTEETRVLLATQRGTEHYRLMRALSGCNENALIALIKAFEEMNERTSPVRIAALDLLYTRKEGNYEET